MDAFWLVLLILLVFILAGGAFVHWIWLIIIVLLLVALFGRRTW